MSTETNTETIAPKFIGGHPDADMYDAIGRPSRETKPCGTCGHAAEFNSRDTAKGTQRFVCHNGHGAFGKYTVYPI